MEALATAMVSMTEAEVFHFERKRAGELSEVDYLRIIRQKTATFMSACCRIGGLAGGIGSDSSRGARPRTGEWLGIAFQIIDDSLDFDGRSRGAARQGDQSHDLREGKRTLPLIVTLDRASADERALHSGDAQEPTL